MTELHELSPVEGSNTTRTRVGRGPGSGKGKRSGRGQKGQKARSGGNIPAGFEGGQMPLHRRLPKRGFTNVFRTEYQVVNVRDLGGLEGEVTPETLADHGLIGHRRRLVKVLGDGELEAKLSVSAHAFSGSAREKIEAAGGSVTVLSVGDYGGGEAQDATAATAATARATEAEAATADEAAEEEEEAAESAEEPEGSADDSAEDEDTADDEA